MDFNMENLKNKKERKVVKVGSPIQAVINTLNKAKEIYYDKGIDLEAVKTSWTEENIDILKNKKIDGLIYTNIHVFKTTNDFLIKNKQEPFVFIQPLYHSKYGLYANKKSK
jgi:D-methionine transport system substrate-binding protein